MHKVRYLNLLVMCIVNFMWAAQYPAYKVASAYMGFINLNFWTFGFAIALLAPFLLRERYRYGHRPKLGALAMREFLILGLVGNIPASVLMAWGIAHSTASNAAVISLTIPVLMVIMAVTMLGERMTWLRWLSVVMALGGTILVSKIDSSSGFLSLSVLAGNVVIFLAGAGAAFYNTYSKKLLKTFTELEVLVYGFVVACVACAIVSLFGYDRPFYAVSGYPRDAWFAVLILGGFSWGIAMMLWMWVLKRLQVTQVSASIYLLSLFGVLLSAITLHERLTFVQIAGALLILVGTFVTSEYDAYGARGNSRDAELRS